MLFNDEIEVIDRIKKRDRINRMRVDSIWFLRRHKQQADIRRATSKVMFKRDAEYNEKRHIELAKYFKKRKEPIKSQLSPGMIKIKGEKALALREQNALRAAKAKRQAQFVSNFTDYRGIRNVILTVPMLLFLSIFLFVIGITDLPAEKVGYMFPTNYNQTYLEYADENGMDLIDLSQKNLVQGYSAVVSNLVANGDFSGGTLIFAGRGTTVSILSNELRVEVNTFFDTNGIQTGAVNLPTIIGNVYYYSFLIKPKYNRASFVMIRDNRVSLGTLTPNVYNNIKNIITAGSGTDVGLRIEHSMYADYVAGDYIYFDNIQLINLTQMVALGLIATPTQQAYETWLEQNTIYDVGDYYTQAWDLRYKFGRNMNYYDTWNINTGQIIDIDSKNFDLYKLGWFGWQKQNISLLDLQDEKEKICDNQCYLDARQQIIDDPSLGYLPEYLGVRTLFGVQSTYYALNQSLRAINFARLKWIFPLWVDSFNEFIDAWKNFNPNQPIYGGS